LKAYILLYGGDPMGKLEDEILNLLSKSEPLTLMEISERLNKKPKSVFRSLRKLFEEGKISCDVRTRRYSLEKDYEQRKEEDLENVEI
jgi:DNA-binding Lrp family transcriptional regulator